jgi:FdhE protein
LLDASVLADAVEDEVAVATSGLPDAVALPAPLADAGGLLADARARVEAAGRWLADPGQVDPTVAFWILVAAQPAFELAAVDVTIPTREQWTAAACPVCGGAAQVSAIAEESGEFMAGPPRSLWCGRCASTWTYPRATCVTCGESDSRRIGSWAADGWPVVRIEACDTCRGYIKSFDLHEEGGLQMVPIVDDVATAALDLWAAGHGLQRPVRSLAGV